MQDIPIMIKELVGARKFKDTDNRTEVREAGSRNKRGVRHLDVAESLAGCCFDIHALSTKPRTSMMTLGAAMKRADVNMRERIRRATEDNRRSVVGKLGEDSW